MRRALPGNRASGNRHNRAALLAVAQRFVDASHGQQTAGSSADDGGHLIWKLPADPEAHETDRRPLGAPSRGTPVTDAPRARMWESGLHAAQTAKTVVTSMYEAAGTSALYIDCPIEREHRDIYAVMQHVVFASMWLEAAGQVRLGLKPQNPFF